MDFGKEGMEADTFKEEDHLSQQTVNDLTSMVPSSSITEKVVSSLYPGWIDNMSDSSSKSCSLSFLPEATGLITNRNVSTDDLSHSQAFQHPKQLSYSTDSDFFSQKLTSTVSQAGIQDESKTLEVLTPLLPASEMNHCATTYKTMEQVGLLEIITEFLTAYCVFLIVAQPVWKERVTEFRLCI